MIEYIRSDGLNRLDCVYVWCFKISYAQIGINKYLYKISLDLVFNFKLLFSKK